MSSDELGRLRGLAGAALGLAGRTTSGRLVLAQIAAVADPALLPEPIRDAAREEMATWRREPEPIAAKDVERQLKSAWGAAPGKVLDDFDPEPRAVTETSQVHRAERDGQAVAVKLLKPGIVDVVRADLSAAEVLAGPMRGALPRSDFGALLAEARERVLDELDLEQEAASQRTLARALRGVDGVRVPRPDSELSHPAVLVREWVDGQPLSADPVPQHAAPLLAALTTAARAGLIYADVEAGNVLVTSDGDLALIDSGALARIDPGRVTVLADMLEAVADTDSSALAAAVQRLGALDADASARAADLALAIGEPLLGGGGAFRLDQAFLGRLSTAAYARMEDAAALAPQLTVVPTDLPALRLLGTAAATLALLGATEDWPRLVAAQLRVV